MVSRNDSGAGWSSPVAREAHNLEVAGSNPVPATCFDGSEIGLPSGYTKGRCRKTPAFLRYRPSYRNELRRRTSSRAVSISRSLPAARLPLVPSPAGRRPVLGRNSRLSRTIAPRGLTHVASARSVANDIVVSGIERSFFAWFNRGTKASLLSRTEWRGVTLANCRFRSDRCGRDWLAILRHWLDCNSSCWPTRNVPQPALARLGCSRRPHRPR